MWSLLSIVSVAAADPVALTSYEALIEALTSGEQVRAITHYGQCLLDSEPGPGAVGGMDLHTFELFPKGSIGNPVGFVSASHTQLILHPAYGHVHNYVKLKFHEDARVEITARYLEPRKLKVVMHEVFGCSLGPNGGLSLFVERDAP